MKAEVKLNEEKRLGTRMNKVEGLVKIAKERKRG